MQIYENIANLLFTKMLTCHVFEEKKSFHTQEHFTLSEDLTQEIQSFLPHQL